jgi:hypothetical protein
LGKDYFDNLAGRLYAAVISDVHEKVGREDRVRGELAGGATLAEVRKRHRVP